MFWTALAMIGFPVLMASVIALASRSTRLYEQGHTRATSPAADRSVVAEAPDS